MSLFFVAHREGPAFGIVPPARFLNDLPAVLDHLNVALGLIFYRTLRRRDTVDIFQLSTRSISLRTDRAHGNIDIAPHRSFLHLAVRYADIFHIGPYSIEKRFHLCSASKVRVCYDLHKRNAAPIVIHKALRALMD